MKKWKWLCLALALLLTLNCFPVPANAETADTTQETSEETAETSAAQNGTTTAQEQYEFGLVSIKNGCRTIDGDSPLAGSDRRLDTAVGVFVYEISTDTVVYSYNPDSKIAPGTLNKLMLGLLVVEKANLDEVVTINTNNIARLPAGSANQKLKNGEQISIRNLLYCLALDYANDAGVVLAEHIAGTQAAFVEMMNRRAAELGCSNTTFTDINGLKTDNQFTTARDMAKIMLAVTQNETYVEILSTATYKVPETNSSKERQLKNKDYMISRDIMSKYMDSRCKYGMASYVNADSGASIIQYADNSTDTKQGLKYICAIMGTTRRYYAGSTWNAEYYGNFDEMVELMKFIYENFKIARVVYDGQAIYEFPVANGDCDAFGEAHVNIDTVLPKSAQMNNLTLGVKTTGGGLTAPLEKDQEIATMELWYRNSCVAEARLYAMEKVRTAQEATLDIQNGISALAVNKSGGKAGWVIAFVVLGLACAYFGVNSYLRARRNAMRRRRRAQRRRNR